MPDGPKLLLIDGNNMAHRVFWAGRKRRPDGKSSAALSHKGNEVDMLYGFFRQLIHLDKKYPGYFRIIAWDRGYDRRWQESSEAVEQGLIPSAYKQPRKEAQEEKKDDPDQVSLREQMAELEHGLNLVRCLQVAVPGCEADDVIYSYARIYADFDASSIVVSTDKDFMQVIDANTVVYDAMKKELWNRERFEIEFGFAPHLWVDAGALMGEVGPSKDNIFGVDGWGPKTACQYVAEHGDIDAVVAFVNGKAKRGKKEEVLLRQLERLRLAKSLKQMDILPNIPKPRCPPRDRKVLEKFFLDWGFVSLLKEVSRLV